MKAVLLSVNPQHVHNICEVIGEKDGKPLYKKTIEVRKTKPKLKTPFKVYIYCTNDRKVFLDSDCNNKFWTEKNYGGKHYYNGKVIGEFVCDYIKEFESFTAYDGRAEYYYVYHKETCLGYKEFREYGQGKPLYGWYITDLKIYDKPKELSEFMLARERCVVGYSKCNKHVCGLYPCSYIAASRPPQSWCYVEELQNG